MMRRLPLLVAAPLLPLPALAHPGGPHEHGVEAGFLAVTVILLGAGLVLAAGRLQGGGRLALRVAGGSAAMLAAGAALLS